MVLPVTDTEAGTGPSCPQCGSTMTPIVYGYPGPDMFEAEERGEVVIGGCVVFDGRPSWRCTSCQPLSSAPRAGLPRTVAEAWAAQGGSAAHDGEEDAPHPR